MSAHALIKFIKRARGKAIKFEAVQNTFDNTEACMLASICHMTLKLGSVYLHLTVNSQKQH